MQIQIHGNEKTKVASLLLAISTVADKTDLELRDAHIVFADGGD